MEIIKTEIPDLLIIKNKVFEDSRGYFTEAYNKRTFLENGINIEFGQDNRSKSSYGVIRGLHFQLNPHSQTKLVSVISGSVYDVAVDLRKGSPTFGKWYGIELTESNHLQFLIPQGFAHGFSVLSETAIFSYKCDNYYSPEHDRGIAFDDPALAIDWKIPQDKISVPDKDKKHPLLKDQELNFSF